MGTKERLQVRVNDELVLDAGGCAKPPRARRGLNRLVHPPATTLFHQVLDYLRENPGPTQKRPSGSLVGREGVAAAALALRWGSYLAVLLDHDKPVWPEVGSPNTSRISDEEMARINIESSAALEEWIDIYRADPGGRRFEQLVNRAVVSSDAEEEIEAQGHRILCPLGARDGLALGRGVQSLQCLARRAGSRRR